MTHFRKLSFLLLIASLVHAPVRAEEPHEMQVYLQKLGQLRPSGSSPDRLQARQVAQEKKVAQKNRLEELRGFQLAAAAATLIEPGVTQPTQVGWSGGSTYPFVAFDPKVPGRAYALSDSAGFYRSEDGGTTWMASNTGLVNLTVASLAIAPSNSNVLYLGSTAGVHRSNDGGKTWVFSEASRGKVPFRRLSNHRSIAVDALDPNKVFAGASTGEVFQSLNGGGTWTQVGTLGIGVPVSALHLMKDGRLFAGSSKGLMLFQGGAWQKVALKSDLVYDMVSIMHAGKETLYITNGRNVAHTSDFGNPKVWWYANMVPPFDATGDGHLYRIAVRTSRDGRVQILASQRKDWGGRLWFGDNHGATWKEVGLNFINDPAVNPTREWKKSGKNPWLTVAFDPRNDNTFVATDDWGLFRSTDAGTSWNESITGTPNTMGTTLLRDPLTGTYLVGTMDNGVVELNPQTGALKAVFPTASTPWQLHGHVWDMEVLADGTRVIAASPWNSPSNVIIVIAPDGTQTVATGLPLIYPTVNTIWEKGYLRTLVADPKNPGTLYAGIDGDGGGLFVSRDSGRTWQPTTGQPASKRVYNGLAIDPVETSRLFWGTMGAGGGIYRSTNGGAGWTKVFSGSSNVAEVVVDQNQVVYAGVDNGGPALYVSRDKGTTWGLLKKFEGTGGPLQAITIDPANPNRMIVSSRKWSDYTGAKIWYTADAGKTWVEIAKTGLPNTSGASDAVFSQDGKSAYLLMTAGSLFQVPLP